MHLPGGFLSVYVFFTVQCKRKQKESIFSISIRFHKLHFVSFWTIHSFNVHTVYVSMGQQFWNADLIKQNEET